MSSPPSPSLSSKGDIKGDSSIQHIENAGVQNEDMAFTRAVLRKIDFRMLPLLGIIYAFALIDRTNLGAARTAGMDVDLGTNIGNRFSIVSCVYFVPYIIFQLPSNLYVRHLGIVNWLSFCVTSWGAVQLAMGFVPTWGFLALCRVLLGAFEAGFFPALVYLITTWYTRHEVQKRLAAFYLLSILAGGFSTIFAYALSLLNGKRGIAGWSWIFIIDGAITMFFGIVAWFFLPDFPHQNKFLTAEQTAHVLRRVELDRGDSIPDLLTGRKVLDHLSDWKVWAFALMFMCATMPAYAIGFFITLILRGMGWSVMMSLVLSAPPYVFSAISIFFFAWLSDKYRQRALFLAIQTFITLIGLCITGFVPTSGWRYFGIYLSNAGSGGCIPGILAYSANNIVSHTKRAVTTAAVISLGGVGGIFATTVFRQADAPRYLPGIYATMACQGFMLILLSITTTYFWHQNNRARQGKLSKPIEGQVGFLYTL